MDDGSCSDVELVGRVRGGDSGAFAVLVSRYQDYMFNAIVHLVGPGHDVEDLAQEVFLKAYRGLKGFGGRAKFSTWLYGIMLNCVRSHWRTRGRRPTLVSLHAGADPYRPDPEQQAPGDGPPEEVMRAERVDMVRSAIGELSEDLREVIVLRDLQGLSYEHLAASLKLPLGTVKSRLSRARSALKDKIAPLMGEGP